MATDNATAKAILDANDVTIAHVMVREWNNIKVRLRSWDASERFAFDAESTILEEILGEDEASDLLIPRAVAWSCVDDAGQPAFRRVGAKAIKKARLLDGISDSAKEKAKAAIASLLVEYRALSKKSARGLLRLWKVVSDMNALGADAEEAIEKN